MIYVDSCLLIYAIEDDGHLGQRSRALLSSQGERFAISPLVMLEALVLPLRGDDAALRARYESLFEQFILLEIGLPQYLHAAEIRAVSAGLKTADALHVATAQLAGCTVLWTGDRRLAAASASFAVDVIGDPSPDEP